LLDQAYEELDTLNAESGTHFEIVGVSRALIVM
jgi:hypothetical protein